MSQVFAEFQCASLRKGKKPGCLNRQIPVNTVRNVSTGGTNTEHHDAMTNRKIYLFPDTNLFFQCRDIPSLPWRDLGDFTDVELIVVRPVQKEIDYRKGEGTTRLGKRARKAHGLLRDVTANQLQPLVLRESNPRVTLSLRVDLKPDIALANILDYDEADDRLVGIASAFAAENAELPVATLTHDGGVMASAVTAGVKHYIIPDTWLSPPEETKVDKELKAARAEVQRLSSAEPKFRIACIDGEGRSIDRIVLQSPDVAALSSGEIEALMQRARERFPKKTDFAAPTPPRTYTGGGFPIEALKGVNIPPTDRQIANYHAEYEKWEKQLETALGQAHRWLSAEASKLTVSFRAENVGTRPAEKVLVELAVHGEFFIGRPKRDDEEASKKKKKRLPSPPAAPTRPIYPALANAISNLGWLDRGAPYISPMFHQPKPHDAEGFYYKTGALGSKLRLTCDLWRHSRDRDFDVLVEPFDYENAAGAIEFRIQASNLTDAVSLTVPLEINSPKLSAFDFAANLIDKLCPKQAD